MDNSYSHFYREEFYLFFNSHFTRHSNAIPGSKVDVYDYYKIGEGS